MGRWWRWAGRVGTSRGRGCREVFSSRESTSSSAWRGRVERSIRAATVASQAASRGGWGTATAAGARAAADGRPASATPWRPRSPVRSPRRCADARVRYHPTARGDDPPGPVARRRRARRGSRPPGAKPPLAPRPGASERPSRRWARTCVAPWRTTVRCTPTACTTANGEAPAANERIILPRRIRPAARGVDRCHRSSVCRSLDARTMRQEDVRPRAIAISSQPCGSRWGRDTGTGPSRQAHLHRCS